MRSIILMGVFVVWCILASQWYLFEVKGLLTDPAHFKPHENTIAIVEILTMMLVAVLIGFGIAWSLRQPAIDNVKDEIAAILSERRELIRQNQEIKEQIELAENKLNKAQQTFKADIQSLESEKEKWKAGQGLERKETNRLREELQLLRPKVQVAEIELGRATVQMKQVETQLSEAKEANQRLKLELEELQTAKRTVKHPPAFSDFITDQRSRYSDVSEKEKDDLKMISGIGPMIEKKLNALGIYTFKQISEFTPQMIEHVTSSIKFFPDRIGRDNWIGQAAALMRHKK
jgi:predicted flap endonuclease-1-like 5' DNA nuclease